jgi:hypothetical protein
MHLDCILQHGSIRAGRSQDVPALLDRVANDKGTGEPETRGWFFESNPS